LVPLILVKPWAAVVVCIEAVVTYGIVWFYSTYLARRGYWTDFFGRDRFFALLVVSVLVRIIFDILLLPDIGAFMNETFAINFDYTHNLQSFGLIVVALIANMFWKPGLRNGLLPVGCITLITYLIVRYLLMEFTNFSVGNLAYMYEDLAASMLASPKAYIILLATAALASRMNRYYGWEFNGILIPSLIALQWYRPWKLLITFGETLLVLALASLVLRLPIFQRTTMEGARKILLFFNINFLLKLALGHLWLGYLPDSNVSDFYGFGYLLTTLMAIKMHDKSIPLIMTRATLQTSLVSVIVASLAGFGLTLVPNLLHLKTKAATAEHQLVEPLQRSTRLVDLVREEKVRLYQGLHRNAYAAPQLAELELLETSFRSLSAMTAAPSPEDLARIGAQLGKLNYRVELVESRYLCMVENDPRRGWGFFVFNMDANNRLLVEVPAPMNEWGVMEAGANIFQGLGARAFAVAGTSRYVNDNGDSDVLVNPRTPLAVFHRQFGRSSTLQLRGYTRSSSRQLSNFYPAGSLAGEELPSTLWLMKDLPPDLNMGWLENYLGDFQIRWGKTPATNILRALSGNGFTQLNLTRADRHKLLFQPLVDRAQLPLMQQDQSIVGYLQDWLLSDKQRIAPKESELYQPARLEELLYFDEEVLKPLVRLTNLRAAGQQWNDQDMADLNGAAQAAEIMGYEILRYRHVGSNSTYLILSERDANVHKRYWGIYVFRTSEARPYLVQIPRPLAEINVFEYAVALYERLNARFLLIGGAHPKANSDGSADLIQTANKSNLFNLTYQAALREGGDEPLLAIQCRAQGFSEKPAEKAALLWMSSGINSTTAMGKLDTALYNILRNDLGSVGFVGESSAASRFSGGGSISSLYLEQVKNKDMAVVWLSPLARLQYRQQTSNRQLDGQMKALNISRHDQDLFSFIKTNGQVGKNLELPEEMELIIQEYLASHNIVLLHKALERFPRYRFSQLIDTSSKQVFLVIDQPHHGAAAIVNLYPRDMNGTLGVEINSMSREDVANFVESRIAWLKFKVSG
ncbi:MAG: hypothetical protein HKN69_08070, partial [Desulfofustis sp.]|nr:hypothetical protein [Desulfofustis sp.]